MDDEYLNGFNPFKVFNISPKSSIKEARYKFIATLKSCSEKVKRRYCLAFDMICNKISYYVINGIFWVKKKDEFYYVNIGNLKELKKLLHSTKNKCILSKKDALKRTLLYLAARNGYYDIVAYLIKIGTI